MRLNFHLVLLVSLMTACSDPGSGIDPVLEHFPLELSNSWEYDVVENTYSAAGINTLSYTLLDSITKVDEDLYGNRTFEVSRYIWDGNSLMWQLQDIYTVNKVLKQVLEDHANVPEISFVYPPKEGKSWDANAYNTQGEKIYTMRGVDSDHSVEGTTYSGTVEVVKSDNEDLIVHLERESEYFARNVGMIENVFQSYFFCQEPSCLGQQEIEAGRDSRWILVHYRIN